MEVLTSHAHALADRAEAVADGEADVPQPIEDLLAIRACIAYALCMQYTIRGIPAAIDNALRARARAAGKSLNQWATDVLKHAIQARG